MADDPREELATYRALLETVVQSVQLDDTVAPDTVTLAETLGYGIGVIDRALANLVPDSAPAKKIRVRDSAGRDLGTTSVTYRSVSMDRDPRFRGPMRRRD